MHGLIFFETVRGPLQSLHVIFGRSIHFTLLDLNVARIGDTSICLLAYHDGALYFGVVSCGRSVVVLFAENHMLYQFQKIYGVNPCPSSCTVQGICDNYFTLRMLTGCAVRHTGTVWY